MTKAHAHYLESELIRLAKKAGRVTFENSNDPQERRLPKAHRSDMDYFIGQLPIVLPVLGINAIRVRGATTPDTADILAQLHGMPELIAERGREEGHLLSA